MVISAQEVLKSLKYDEAEMPTVEAMVLGAEAFLKIAGAYRADNDLTKVVIIAICGFWMDNRESNYSEYKTVGDFPLGVNSLVTMLQLSEPDPTTVVLEV